MRLVVFMSNGIKIQGVTLHAVYNSLSGYSGVSPYLTSTPKTCQTWQTEVPPVNREDCVFIFTNVSITPVMTIFLAMVGVLSLVIITVSILAPMWERLY